MVMNKCYGPDDQYHDHYFDCVEELCEHGLSLWLCAGPGHYPMDSDERSWGPIYDNRPDYEPEWHDYEESTCPACDRADCTFPPECQEAVGIYPERSYPHHDTDEEEPF